MSLIFSVTRRSFLAAQAALTGLAALPVAVSAATETLLTGPAKGTYDVAQSCLPARWTTATAEELRRFVGDRFRVRTREHGTIAMRLTALEPVNSGPHRPASLARREGVVAVLESPDIEAIVAAGHQNCQVSHPEIGTADMFLGPVPKRSGGHVVELILN